MNTDTGRVWHYVKPNETTRIPRHHIFLDTESTSERVTNGAIQRWRLGVARYYRCEKGRKPVSRYVDYMDTQKLWEDVSGSIRDNARTILWTHNLQYDLRISRALEILPTLGWEIISHNFSPRNTWVIWRRGTSTLTMVDSLSVFPVPLATVGKTIGLGKLSLPDNDGSIEAWLTRCRRDVEILSTAVIKYLEWIESEDLGNWQMTGSGQAWAAFRHRFMKHRLLVHADETALAAERHAMWTGRCEAYWHGALPMETLHEWDMTLAYPRIAQSCPVPVRYLGPMPPDSDWRRWVHNDRVALLAEVTVTTDAPIVPTHHEGRVLWPVGTFQTTLWSPELAALIESGAEVTVTAGWLYRKRPALQDWADWVIRQLDDQAAETDALIFLVLKNWGKALIGRMAMTYQGWEKYAEAPSIALSRSQCLDVETGESYELMQVGNSVWRSTGRTDWEQSMPMVTGYVQSECRARVWRILSAMPPKSTLYCDTDSIMVLDDWAHAVADVCAKYPEYGLRLKRSWDGFAIWGPRQILTGERVRISGIPRTAERADDGSLTGAIWDSLATAMKLGNPNQVVTRDRVWRPRGVDKRRTGPEFGWTEARRLPELATVGCD